MIDKETYEREITRMFDSVRTNSKGEHTCSGVKCEDCPLYYHVSVCHSYGAVNAYEVYEKTIKCINYVERWSKEHPQKYKISPFEYEYLKLYQKYGFGSDRLCDLTGTTILHELFYLKDIDLNVKVEDILLNCEVTEDD